MKKADINKYFKEELTKKEGTIILNENQILELYINKCFTINELDYYKKVLESVCIEYSDIAKTLIDSVSKKEKKNKKKIKKEFIKVIEEELFDIINYDNCSITLKKFIDRIPPYYIAEAARDIISEYKPVLSKIYVIADKICRDKKGDKYSKEIINKYVINSFKYHVQLYSRYNTDYEQPKDKKNLDSKRLKHSYESYYNKYEIEDYGDNTEYPTNITNSKRK